jgi:hypothetical protein
MCTIAQPLQIHREELQMRHGGVQGLKNTQWHPLENLLKSRNKSIAALKAYRISTHHPTIMGDMRNGHFKDDF